MASIEWNIPVNISDIHLSAIFSITLTAVQIWDAKNGTNTELQLKQLSYRDRRSYVAFCQCFWADPLT
jgi:hypothetical protein